MIPRFGAGGVCHAALLFLILCVLILIYKENTMGYYERKPVRKVRIKCCAECGRGLRGRWWWMGMAPHSDRVASACGHIAPRYYHVACWSGKGVQVTDVHPEYRCAADQEALKDVHSNVEALREYYGHGRGKLTWDGRAASLSSLRLFLRLWKKPGGVEQDSAGGSTVSENRLGLVACATELGGCSDV